MLPSAFREAKDSHIVAFDIDESELPCFEGLIVSKEKALTIREAVMARIRIELHYDKPVAERAKSSGGTSQQADGRAGKKRKSIFASPDDPEHDKEDF